MPIRKLPAKCARRAATRQPERAQWPAGLGRAGFNGQRHHPADFRQNEIAEADDHKLQGILAQATGIKRLK